ncbi:preprotein translocase subunit Sec61beta [Candidatus Woesearchaeota archaeon]|nr:preprotein translocase subunit Sec61beta [Candidatus Woesearchaeota archaeon]
MAKDSRIRLPSGMGGITRYFDETKSKLEIKPGTAIAFIIVIAIFIILLHLFIGPIIFS